MNKIIISLIIIAVIVLGVLLFTGKKPSPTPQIEETVKENVPEPVNTQEPAVEKQVKEFTMESFVEFVDGQPKPQFSLKEITVNKGDTVRIKVTNKKGSHDFKLDEYDIFEETPLDQEVVIEFVADKSGSFVYYCNQPGHRQAGHWGTLIVTE